MKKLKQWALRAFGRAAGRNSLRRILRDAGLTWKEVKKLLGKAEPEKRAAHTQELLKLFAGVRDGDVLLVYAGGVHLHRDLDLGYDWGRKGQRLWRRSDCPKRQGRPNAYGAYDLSNGACLLWQGGWCDGGHTVAFPRELVRWRAGKQGRLVVIWDSSPCHTARAVKEEAARLGIELLYLPGYSPDLNPIQRLWDWLREGVTRGHCHKSVPELFGACQTFIARVNQDPVALVDRLWPKFELDPEFEAKLRVPK